MNELGFVLGFKGQTLNTSLRSWYWSIGTLLRIVGGLCSV